MIGSPHISSYTPPEPPRREKREHIRHSGHSRLISVFRSPHDIPVGPIRRSSSNNTSIHYMPREQFIPFGSDSIRPSFLQNVPLRDLPAPRIISPSNSSESVPTIPLPPPHIFHSRYDHGVASPPASLSALPPPREVVPPMQPPIIRLLPLQSGSSSNTPKQTLQCHPHHDGQRNLIVCIDGTSNRFGIKNTNVIGLYYFVEKGPLSENGHFHQNTWYNSGIGTYARASWRTWQYWGKAIYNAFDLMLALNFEDTILGAYRWLSETYEPGDRIFLFGFSRGAFQVRVLSAMIHRVGLIHKGNEMQIPFAYEVYTSTGKHHTSNSRLKSLSRRFEELLLSNAKKLSKRAQLHAVKTDPHTMAARFKELFSRDVKVHFVGAWDTVSSVGWLHKHIPPDTESMPNSTCFFRHALALDERRVKFQPECIHYPPNSEHIKFTDHDGIPNVKEVWFSGTHSDVGGGNFANPDFKRAPPPLRWMVYEARAVGLHLSDFRPEHYQSKLEFKKSLKGGWWLAEILPVRRFSFRLEGGLTRWPNLGSSRKIYKGQKIHASVASVLFDRPKYTPSAHPHSFKRSSFWEKLRYKDLSLFEFELEVDSYERAMECAMAFLHSSKHGPEGAKDQIKWSERMKAMINKPEERLALTYVISQHFGRLLGSCLDGEVCLELLRFLVDLGNKLNKENEEIPELRNGLSKIEVDEHLQKTVKDIRFHFNGAIESQKPDSRGVVVDFLNLYKNVSWPMLIHRDEAMLSLAFSRDNSLLLVGSEYGTIGVWETTTSRSFSPLHLFTLDRPHGVPAERRKEYAIRCLALSSDNKYCAAIQTNGELGIWSKIGLGYSFLQIRQTTINDVEQIISATFMETRAVAHDDTKPLKLLLVSAKRDIVTLDMQSVLKGFTSSRTDVSDKHALAFPLQCLAVHVGGKYIASVTSDFFFDILHTAKSTLITHEQLDRKSYVQSMAFSRDAKYVVCAENNGSVWIWHMLEKKKIPILERVPQDGGQAGSLTAIVAFSPNTKYVLATLTYPRGGCIRVIEWNSSNKKPFCRSFEVACSVSSACFSADNEMIVAGTTNGTIWVWDIRNVCEIQATES